MKLTLIIAYIAVSLLACYAQSLCLNLFHLEPGNSAPITFRADRPFDFDQAKAFGGKRNRALSQYVPLYIFSPEEVNFSRKKMEDFIALLSKYRKEGQLNAGVLAELAEKQFGLRLAPDAAKQLADYSGLQNLLDGMLAIENTLMQNKILKKSEPLKGKGTAEVRYPPPMGTVAYPASGFLTLEEARQRLQKQADQVFWQVDRQVLAPAVAIASAALSPNLEYDQKENDRRIEEIMQRYPSKVIHYRSTEVLVPARKTLTEEDILLLAANRKVEQKDLPASISWVALAIIILTVLYNAVLSQVGRVERRSAHSPSLHLCVLIISILIFSAILLLTPWPAYLLPIGFIPLAVILLDRSKLAAAFTTLLGAAVAGLISGRNIQTLMYFIVGGMTALLACRTIRKRSQILIPSTAAAAVCGVMAFSIGLDRQAIWSTFNGWIDPASLMVGIPSLSLLRDTGWAVLSGLIAGPLALAILPLLELALRTASTFKIDTWTNLEHPLLKDLLNRAPGTYQHTMSVANLAQAAGEAIGANVPLLRAGVYFHDIGKMVDPGYFAENQSTGPNLHDSLEAPESARVIMDHVRKGVLMGRRAKLPQVILDFIPQHHGTLVLECFWDKAKQNGAQDRTAEGNFRYPGPKPQSIEAAILMISDAVEAASRTLPERTPEAIEALVRHIMGKRIDDGQFDECKITTDDLAKVRAALIDAVAAAFHNRVRYPWQEEKPHGPDSQASDRT